MLRQSRPGGRGNEKERAMANYEDKGKDFGCGEREWQGIVDKIEDAIILSLANRVLKQAAIKEEKHEENRKSVRLLEFRGHSRKKHVSLPSRRAS
jgi:hypothetical protein